MEYFKQERERLKAAEIELATTASDKRRHDLQKYIKRARAELKEAEKWLRTRADGPAKK